jgi:hypothetical protein
MKIRLFLAIIMVGLLSACANQATGIPASPPTDEPVPATQALTNTPASTDTPPATNTTEPTSAPTTEVTAISFANDILPILQSRCKNCHGGNKIEEGLILLSHAEVMKGSENGPVVVPGNANESLLVELLLNQKMPKRGPKLTPPQVQLIVDWVNQGALDN